MKYYDNPPEYRKHTAAIIALWVGIILLSGIFNALDPLIAKIFGG